MYFKFINYKKLINKEVFFQPKKPFKRTSGLVKSTYSENTNIKQYLKNSLTAVENVYTQFDYSY